MPTARPAALAAATILALALTLTGCFPQIPTLPGIPVDGGSGDGSGDSGDGGDGGDGGDVGDGGTKPADWPANVPTLDGFVEDAGSASIDGLTTWYLNMKLDGDAETVYEEGNALLSDAGLEAGFAGFGDGSGASTWSSGDMTVYFTVTPDDSGSLDVDYAISN